MKAGRNDPCPCGSGKKYKKCCLLKDQEAADRLPAAVIPPSPAPPAQPSFLPSVSPRPKAPAAPRWEPPASRPAPPPRPRDPLEEKWDAIWEEFESQDDQGRVAVFLKVLDDKELLTDEGAFEMLSRLRDDAAASGDRSRSAEWVDLLRERRPDLYDADAHWYLSWALQDAVVEGRTDVVGALAVELAARAGQDIDIVNRAQEMLAYHGQLSALVASMRAGWSGVKDSGNVVPWGISGFAERGCRCEIFDYLEHTASPDPADPALVDRIKFYIDEPRLEYLSQLVGDLTGQTARAWTVADFALKPPRKKSRRGWDDDSDEDEKPVDEGVRNLNHLVAEFIGYLRREEGVPFSRGELIQEHLASYFFRRNEGDLDPKPSMLEQALHPNKTLPKPPRPIHPLCLERVTLDVHLGSMLGMFGCLYHAAAALFEIVPAWLRFLESRGLIDADTRRKNVEQLMPLRGEMLTMWEKFSQDPALLRAAQAWPEDAAKGPGDLRP